MDLTEAGLLRNINANPYDNNLRCIAADWYQEQSDLTDCPRCIAFGDDDTCAICNGEYKTRIGYTEYAEFIRTHCELYELTNHIMTNVTTSKYVTVKKESSTRKEKVEQLRRKVLDLWGDPKQENSVARYFLARLPCGFIPHIDSSVFTDDLKPPLLSMADRKRYKGSVTIQRGFTAYFNCDLNYWIEDGPALVQQPIRMIGITDRTPALLESRNSYVWNFTTNGKAQYCNSLFAYRGSPNIPSNLLKEELREQRMLFANVTEAVMWLSAHLIDWAISVKTERSVL